MPCPDARRIVPAILLAGLAVAVLPGTGLAAGEVAGPIEVGPSWGKADPARSSATLFTLLRNHGDLADRLIRTECPASGHVALQDGTVHADVMAPNTAQAQAGAQRYGKQNGLDIPAAVDGQSQQIKATLLLSDAKQPLTDGAHVPCALYFAHDGERVVVFTLGVVPPATPEP